MADMDIAESSSSSYFIERSWKTDLTLVVEGTKLYVAKNILAVASPVFERMFQGSFSEKSESELELPGKNLEDVTEFLRCIYPNVTAQVTSQNALQILALVEEYQVNHLKPRCEKVLLEGIDETTSAKDLFMLLKETSLYNLVGLIEKCVNLASEKSKHDLEEAERKFAVPAEHVRDIYKRLTTKLEDKVKQLEEKTTKLENQADRLQKKASVLQESSSKFAQEVRIYERRNNALTSCLSITEPLKLSRNKKWSGRTLTLELKANESKCEISFAVWDIRFTLILTLDAIAIFNREKNYKLSCQVDTQLVFVNQMCVHSSLKCKCRLMLTSTCRVARQRLRDVNFSRDPEEGFVRGGNVQAIAHVFVSKPVLYAD